MKTTSKRQWAIKKHLAEICHNTGLSTDEVFECLEFQDYKCSICKELLNPKKHWLMPVPDTEPTTGEFCGVLCVSCRLTLYKYDRDPEKLYARAKELRDERLRLVKS